MGKPIVTVVMPVYNAETYVKDAVISILAQSMSQFEFIIIDDCSTDQSLQICKEVVKEDKRVKIVQLKENGGIVNALNQAIKISSGKYIARMDADDISNSLRLEKQLNYLELNQELALCGTAVSIINEENEKLYSPRVVVSSKKITKMLTWVSPVAHPTWMVRKIVYDEVGSYRNVAPAEDYDFLLRVRNAGWKISNISYVGLQYRLSSSNTASKNALFQRKAFNYVKRINNKRLPFNSSEFQAETASNSISVKIHQFSENIINKGIQMKWNGKISYPLYILIGVISSPWQLQFIIRSSIAKLYNRIA